MNARSVIAALAATLAFAAACERGPRSAPILVVGVDGLEWDLLLPLMAEGRLPNLEGLMARGAYGLLQTFRPTISPTIWTSVATGKRPSKHGILGFAYQDPAWGIRLFTNSHRKTKAIWNIASDYGQRVATVGWWMTYPVEEVNGVMVAQTNTEAQLDTRWGTNVWKGTLVRGLPGQVYPPERQNAMLGTLAATDEGLPELTREIFGPFRHPLSTLGKRLWGNCQWAFRADATYLEIALDLQAEGEPFALTMVYFGGPDVAGHRFWRYLRPELYEHPPSRAAIENFGNVIFDYYAYIDDAIGRLVDALPADPTVFVLSDHGMHAVNRDRRFDPDDPPEDVNSAEHQDAPPGVLIAAGPGIRPREPAMSPARLERRDLTTLGNVLDVTPTLLTLLGIPAGEDMDGSVLNGILRENHRDPQVRVATHDTPVFLTSRPRVPAPASHERERLEQLRSLGYLRDP